jgi:hypothetical protein
VTWTLAALPNMTIIASVAADLADPKFSAVYPAIAGFHAVSNERLIHLKEETFRIYTRISDKGPYGILLPLDRYFEVRARFAIRLWRALSAAKPGDNPAALTSYRRDALVRQLRALDGKLCGASNSEIAAGLFGRPAISASSWKTHDLRARADRAIRRGIALMRGQYRQLLLHPYRRTVPARLLRGVDHTPK